jgi:hypothetical protein
MPTDAEKFDIGNIIRDAIGWALTKDINRLFSIMAQDEDFFIFHPDSKSTIVGFDAFKQLGERVWMREEFKATDFAVRGMRIKFAEMGNVAWYSCFLDDHAEWNGKPTGWDNARWTGVLEKRNDQWVIVQMHFSFPKDD